VTHQVPDAILRQDKRNLETITAVLAQMKEDPAFEARARGVVTDLIAKKSVLLGDAAKRNPHLARWAKLACATVEDLETILLEESANGREMRHAHFFAGLVNVNTFACPKFPRETPGDDW